MTTGSHRGPTCAARAARGRRPRTTLHGRHLPRHEGRGSNVHSIQKLPPRIRARRTAHLECRALPSVLRRSGGTMQPRLRWPRATRPLSPKRQQSSTQGIGIASAGRQATPHTTGEQRPSTAKVRRTSPTPLSQGSLYLPDRHGEPSVGVPPSNDCMCRLSADTARAEDGETRVAKGSTCFPTASLPPNLVGT